MNFRDRPRSVWALPLLALAAVVAMLGSDWAGLASGFRGFLFDSYQRASPRPYAETRSAGYAVRVLDIDSASVARFGAWPWPRATLAKVITELRAQGAQMVVLTVPLDQADPASPRNLIAEIPAGPSFDATRAALEQMPSPDTALTAAFAGIATVSGFVLGQGPSGTFAPHATVGFMGEQAPFGQTQDFPAATGPIAPLAKAGAGSGALNLSVDRDGELRRMPLVFRLNGKAVPSLDAEALRVAENKRALSFRAGDGGDLLGGTTGVSSVEAFRRDLPTAPDGSLWIAYSRHDSARNVSAAQLDDHTLPPDLLKSAIVYIGAPDDIVATPFGPRSAASVHAEAMENMLLGQVLRRPAAANKAELALLLLVGLALTFVLLRFGVWWAGLLTVVAVAGAGAISWRLFAANHVLFDSLGPGVGLALVFAAGAAARMLEVAGARARLHEAFAASLAPGAIERIARNPALLKLEGETRNVTYLVCGVRGFTGLAASFADDPVAFTRLLARVFTPLMDEALAHRGTIDRVSAEGFSCFWNAPLDDPEHAIHACEAASGMMEVIAKVNDIVTHERRIDGTALAPVEIGIGLSTGPAIAGGFKSHGRTTYSAVGDCAVTAQRIQALSGTYGPAVIVSEETRRAAERGFAFLEVDFVEIGASPVKLYALLGNPVMRASPKFRALSTFHDHIFQSLRTQQWEKTRDLIDQCRKLSGASQKLYDLQLTRIAWYEAHPPGPDWDGAFRPAVK
jgi:adenylate cyclase